MKTILIALLISLMCFPGLLFASGEQEASKEEEAAVIQGEAPMLRELVLAGTLPPLEERLPLDPLVLEPVDGNQIGRYGGTIRLADQRSHRSVNASGIKNWARPFVLGPDMQTFVPNVAKDFEFSEDWTSVTLTLREGMKWSDGAPLTADDFMFWYDDMYMNEELYPNPLANKLWSPGGKPVEVEKLDDYTVKFTFAQTYPVMPYVFQIGSPLFHYFYWPKHYLSQFHPNHTPREKVEAMAEEAGYDNWVLFFKSKIPSRPYNFSETYIGIPTVEAYEMTAFGNNVGLFERNPYYWKVDAERNQLPYIDRMQVSHVGSKEVLLLKLANGELDYERYNLDMVDFPYLIENQEQGGYSVYKNWVSPFAPLHNYRFNQTTKDPVLREIFRDVRFRRAMSLAINRDEINELLFFGTGTPMQSTVNNRNSRLWRDEYAFADVEYKPDEANRLLDEMGLAWDEDRKWRLRPDGKRLSFVNVWPEGRTYLTDATELVTEYWAAVGVEMIQRPMDVAIYPQLIQNNDYDLLSFPAENFESLLIVTPRIYVPCCHWLTAWGQLWFNWYESGGETGEEPPAEVKVLYDHLETLQTSPDDAARERAMHSLLRAHAENLWTIGTVGLFPQLVAANKNIGNMPDIGITAHWMTRHDSVANPEIWFFKEGN